MPLMSPRQSSILHPSGGRCRGGPCVFLSVIDYILRNMLHGPLVGVTRNTEGRKCGASVLLALRRARRFTRSSYRGDAQTGVPASALTLSSHSSLNCSTCPFNTDGPIEQCDVIFILNRICGHITVI